LSNFGYNQFFFNNFKRDGVIKLKPKIDQYNSKIENLFLYLFGEDGRFTGLFTS